MKTTSPQVDAYIARSAEFARPILERIRKVFHKGCPELEETIKWGVPHFDYKGIMGGMAAFKQHVSFGFWKGELMSDPQGLFKADPKQSMCAVKASKPADLPPEKVLVAYVKQAAKLNDEGKKVSRMTGKGTRKDAKDIKPPADLLAALKKNKKALAAFEGFNYSNRKDYVEWITEAKQEATRQKRLATAIEWMAAGKPRNWKYMKGRC